MGRDLNPKCKQCRREGTKLLLKGDRCLSSKCALLRRSYVPGTHGPRLGKGGRLTAYGLQLRAKQKAKRTYGILEKPLRNYFEKATLKTGDTGAYLYRFLESRLDNVVYRSGLGGSSRNLSRQLINHGHFLVNGRKVDVPSCQLKVADKVSIRPASLKRALFKDFAEKLKNREYPDWLNVDEKDLTVTVVGLPDLAKNPPNFDIKLITEFYSR